MIGGDPALVTSLFDVILIETHNECTRTCWFCKFGQDRQDPEQARMSWPTIERIVGNLRDLSYRGRISWFWINEPLMDPRIVEIIRYTREHCPDAFLSLVTNGDLLTDATYKELRRNGLDALGISIYDNPAAKQAEAIEQDGRLVPMDMRHARIPRLENRGGNIKRHARLFAEARHARRRQGCARPFSMMTVNAKGQVVLCCADLYSDVVMGDVMTDRLEQIWTNERFQAYRTHLNERGREGLPLCGECSYEGSASSVRYPLRAPPPKSAAPPVGWARRGMRVVRDGIRAQLLRLG
jgi:radical SAM protein with 4Fe4S-binding SPASM domain